MKGYRFYAELPAHRASKAATKKHDAFTRAWLENLADSGLYRNVIAVMHENGTNGAGDYDALSAVRDVSNSPVESAGVSPDYLRKRGVLVSEALARRLHPALFRALAQQQAAEAVAQLAAIEARKR